jgi:hypothetical protein
MHFYCKPPEIFFIPVRHMLALYREKSGTDASATTRL